MIKKGLFILIAVSFLTAPLYGQGGKYAVIKLEGTVSPVMADYCVESMRKAENEGAKFIVIQMDTPGGLMNSMRDIIKEILNSRLPVVVYTYPRGAQAASAGGFIMLSAHVAVMAPGTEIGAMHPVSPMLDYMKKDKKGGPAGPMEKKVLNDTIAYARSLAQERKRNVRWAERAVRDAISNTANEAASLNVIDFVAGDMKALMKKLDGRKVRVKGKIHVFKTSGLAERAFTMDWKQRLLQYFADPQIIFLLFIIAVAGIGIEFKNPGMIVPGVAGAISLIIFLIAIQVIPINAVGLLLIVLAVVLFILELSITSYGLLTIGGLVSFVIGSMILFDSPLPGGHVSMSSIIAGALVVLAFVFIVVKAVLRAHRLKVTTGREGMVGERGVVIRGFPGKGKIMIRGEIWNAQSEDELQRDDAVTVQDVDGMVLHVKKEQ